MRIAVLDDYLQLSQRLADWSRVQQQAEVTVFDRHLGEEEAVRELADFDAVCHLRERMAMPASLIDRLPRLKLIVVTGFEHRTLDLAAAAQRGILVTRAPNKGEGLHATPELAWGLILSLARKIPQSAAGMKQGAWQLHAGSVLRGKTLGLLGLGRIGRCMVPIARAFGMEVLAWSSRLTPEEAAAAGATWAAKDELLARSDYVSLHLVLGERSRHTIAARELALMKPGACLVNTARAGLVDEAALLHALQNRLIAGAGLDVFEHEPLPADHPFRRLDNAILTPHLGYTVEESLRAFYAATVECLEAWLCGTPIRVVEPTTIPETKP
ncbi:D-2-hydroxyacid dehydrogenase family protein [Ramlibacter sp. G-1-2-2]|uniref:D-2-hydroxyacid dehydrogenase family protein n=1 Tax=Ramlibacter agri TaxID=2728837 RepID=A0A848HAS9_9BURK|nr:D-2-hydroxyacid dehydrogenase family protein [Ramlibacter agri]NML47567.1 D-2-hydroxyacid dehydrogenase family protein [Ramlibacter agri]